MYLSGSNITFIGENIFHSNTGNEGGAVYAVESSLHIRDRALFERNKALEEKGGAISLLTSAVTFSGNSSLSEIRFSENTATDGGGALYMSSSLVFFNGSSFFNHNTAHNPNNSVGGALLALNGSRISIFGNSGFVQNQASMGGSLFIENSTLFASGNALFLGNTASLRSGGAVFLGDNSIATFTGSPKFMGNMAILGGGAIAMQNANSADIHGAIFLNNKALNASGGAISSTLCEQVIITSSNFSANTAKFGGGGIDVNTSTLTVGGAVAIEENVADMGGGVNTYESTVYFFGVDNLLEDNRALTFGSGGIQACKSTILISGNLTFYNNRGFNGGALSADRSRVEISNVTTFRQNSAIHQGGALFISSQSILMLSGNGIFYENSAMEGGAMALESSAVLLLTSPLQFSFISNKAGTFGGGIYHSNRVSLLGCNALPSTCFLQLNGSDDNINLNFHMNKAKIAGSVLYGGNLESCQFQSYQEMPDYENNSLSLFRELSTILSNDVHTSTISSDPQDICFCVDDLPDCSKEVYNISDRSPGQLLSIPVVTVGQGNGVVPSIVFAETNSSPELSIDEQIQVTRKRCTNLEYRIRSFTHNISKVLTLYSAHPKDTCSTTNGMHIILKNISFTVLPCPEGFTLKEGACVCLFRARGLTCNIDTGQLELTEKLWLNTHSLLESQRCPDTYCRPPPINISLEDPNVLCLSNRLGVLCGGCKSGLSLTFGTLHCLKCSNDYLALLVPFALAGILLVAIMFLLNLTVAEGTINGLIFYANVVQINGDILLPRDPNFLTVFISWLNLDLGIETCFYDGMDAYVYTWLQFAFPLYLVFLILLVIVAAHYSQRVTKLLGSNPVAVLATIFLLSYTKLMRTIESIVSFVSYSRVGQDSMIAIAWRFDGNHLYLHGWKRVLMWSVAIMALFIALVPFTILLTSWKCLFKHSDKKGCLWTNKIKPIMDAYNGPLRIVKYKRCSKILTVHSWIGILLGYRFSILFAKALNNISALSNLHLVYTFFIASIALPLVARGMYRKWYNNALEVIFHLNIVLFIGTNFYVKVNGYGTEDIVAYLFTGLAFVVFLIILAFHIYLRLCQCAKITFSKKKSDCEVKTDTATNLAHPRPFTTNFVELRESLLDDN